MKALARRIIAGRLEGEVRQLIAEKHPLIVAVTGSVGKTTTKLAIAEVLKTKYKVLVYEGNYNTEIGLPLSIFGLEAPESLMNPIAWSRLLSEAKKRRKAFTYDVVVLEMGADHPGDIKHFMSYIHPDVGVITAIQPVHLEGFGSFEAIADEKWQLAAGSRDVVLSDVDPELAKRKQTLDPAHVVTYGVEQGNYYLEDISFVKGRGFGATLHLRSAKAVSVQVPLVARHGLEAALAAAAVADRLGLAPDDIRKGLAKITPVNGRMNLLPGKNNSFIIDDSYNSSPQAALAALDTLYGLKGRHIAILGTMNELGDYAQKGHEEVGAQASKADLLVTIGQGAREWLAPAALKAGLAKDKVISFDSPYEAGGYVANLLKEGDIVLVKGSQNRVFAEEAAKLLLADNKDTAKLVRQSDKWLRTKQQQFQE